MNFWFKAIYWLSIVAVGAKAGFGVAAEFESHGPMGGQLATFFLVFWSLILSGVVWGFFWFNRKTPQISWLMTRLLKIKRQSV